MNFQLYLNGSTLKDVLPEKFADIVNNIRLLLLSEEQLSKESKLWLLLAIEVTNNRFGPLPGEVTKFYEDNLGAESMASFQVKLKTH